MRLTLQPELQSAFFVVTRIENRNRDVLHGAFSMEALYLTVTGQAVSAKSMPPIVVVLSPELGLAKRIALHLGPQVTVCPATDVPAAEKLLAAGNVAVLLCRDDLPGETGIMFLARHAGDTPWLSRILICAPLDSDLMMHVINEARVFRCVVEPCSAEEINRHVTAALENSLASRARFFAASRADRPGQVLSNWVKILPRLAFLTLLTCGGIFFAGLATLLFLYLLKSLAGIDLFSDAHLHDLWR